MRCAECDESWFVPAPQPIEDLVPLKKQQRVYAEDAPRERAESPRERQEWREEAYEETVEEPLFDPAPSRRAASMGVVSAFAYLGHGLGGWQGGFFFDLTGAYGWTYANAAFAGIANLIVVGSLWFTIRQRGRGSATPLPA